MKIGVALASYITNERHYKLAAETLASISSEEHEIVTCAWDNGPGDGVPLEYQEPFTARGQLHRNDENNVSRAWNRGIACLLGQDCQFVFVPNLDIVLQPGALDRLIEAIRQKPDPLLWTMANWHYLHPDNVNPGINDAPLHDNWVPYPHFSAFMVDHRLFEEVGPFDEGGFKPAYNEDIDMHWRIKLAGSEALQYEGARFYHHGSATIRNDVTLNEANNRTHNENNAYFVRKWGFKPATADDAFTDGMFKFPFNDPAKVGFEKDYSKTW